MTDIPSYQDKVLTRMRDIATEESDGDYATVFYGVYGGSRSGDMVVLDDDWSTVAWVNYRFEADALLTIHGGNKDGWPSSRQFRWSPREDIGGEKVSAMFAAWREAIRPEEEVVKCRRCMKRIRRGFGSSWLAVKDASSTCSGQPHEPSN